MRSPGLWGADSLGYPHLLGISASVPLLEEEDRGTCQDETRMNEGKKTDLRKDQLRFWK